MAEDERELIEHTIEIDEYASAVLKIPKQLTAMDLKGLTNKANKLFNLAEVPIKPRSPRGYVRNILSDSEKADLVKHYDEADDSGKQKMADKMGMTEKALYQKIWTIRKDLKVSPSEHKGKKHSDKFLSKALKLLETKSVSEVAGELGMEHKKLYDLVYNRTGKKPSDFRKV